MTCISKTEYMLWRECAKNAWLKLHRPDIYHATELTEFEQSLIDVGIEVEGVARGLFPGGVLVTGSKADAQEKTTELLKANTMTLLQPVFEKDGLLAAIDVLQFNEAAGEYAIHEIKSSTEIDERHLYDLAFQVILLRKNGRKVSRACLVHLNPNYVRQGDLDLERLFVSVEVTSRVDQIADTVTKEMDEARAYLLSETDRRADAPVSTKEGHAIAARFATPTLMCPSTVSTTSHALATVRKASSNC